MKLKFIVAALGLILMPMAVKSQEAFVPNSNGALQPLTKAMIMGTKTGSGFLALYGKKIKSSLVIDGKSSNVMLPRMSTIFYVFQPKNNPINAWKLVPLNQKKKNRELHFLSTSAYSGSTTDLKDIQLMVTKISDEIYELRPMGELKTGEYALIYVENGVPAIVYDVRVEQNLPPYPPVSQETVMAEFYPNSSPSQSMADKQNDLSNAIVRWYFDSDPRGARIFYRVISQVPNEVKNTNESYMTTTPLEETKGLNIPGLTNENASNVVIEVKVTKRGYEDQIKRYNLRQVLDQQEISGFYELVEK